jgi:hypothetical protein
VVACRYDYGRSVASLYRGPPAILARIASRNRELAGSVLAASLDGELGPAWSARLKRAVRAALEDGVRRERARIWGTRTATARVEESPCTFARVIESTLELRALVRRHRS